MSKILMKWKTSTNVLTTVDQSLDIIRYTHDISDGLHQILYLVGWQHEGHDSKYPDLSTVGPHMASSLSPDSAASLRAAMRLAKAKYNCDLSLHINMTDAYPDSPLWKVYEEKRLFNYQNGKIRPRGGWYEISCLKDWESGMARKRIDAMLTVLPELRDAHTIHVDAFFARPSPDDKYTVDDDARGIKAITDYFHELGIDVTAEFLPSIDFIGYFPEVYHDNLDERRRLLYQEDVFVPGGATCNHRLTRDYHVLGAPFYLPFGGTCYPEAWGTGNFCDITGSVLSDRFRGFTQNLFRTAFLAVWYRQHKLVSHTMTATDYVVTREDGVTATVRMSDRSLHVRQGNRDIVRDGDYFLDMSYGAKPVLVYSLNGCDKDFALPPAWTGKTLVARLFPEDRTVELKANGGTVHLMLERGANAVLTMR